MIFPILQAITLGLRPVRSSAQDHRTVSGWAESLTQVNLLCLVFPLRKGAPLLPLKNSQSRECLS